MAAVGIKREWELKWGKKQITIKGLVSRSVDEFGVVGARSNTKQVVALHERHVDDVCYGIRHKHVYLIHNIARFICPSTYRWVYSPLL